MGAENDATTMRRRNRRRHSQQRRAHIRLSFLFFIFHFLVLFLSFRSPPLSLSLSVCVQVRSMASGFRGVACVARRWLLCLPVSSIRCPCPATYVLLATSGGVFPHPSSVPSPTVYARAGPAYSRAKWEMCLYCPVAAGLSQASRSAGLSRQARTGRRGRANTMWTGQAGRAEGRHSVAGREWREEYGARIRCLPFGPHCPTPRAVVGVVVVVVVVAGFAMSADSSWMSWRRAVEDNDDDTSQGG